MAYVKGSEMSHIMAICLKKDRLTVLDSGALQPLHEKTAVSAII